MKRILFTVLIANALVILSLASCEKDDLFLGPPDNSTTGTSSTPTIIQQVASHWVKDQNGIYVNTFQGLLSLTKTSDRQVKIYLVTSGQDVQINNFISFMGGELWGTNTENDVKINYRYRGQSLPFYYLAIKVVVE